MEFKEAIEKVEKSSDFIKWKTANDNFLTHAFVMLDEANKDIWQFGYFDKKTKKITTFILEKENTSIIPAQDILETGNEIIPLNTADVKISAEQAVKTANDFRKSNYAGEIVAKAFFIIQKSPEAVYNITFFTQSFKTINIKVSAFDGKIIEYSSQSLMGFDKTTS